MIINRLWRKEIPLHGLGLNVAFFGCEIKEKKLSKIISLISRHNSKFKQYPMTKHLTYSIINNMKGKRQSYNE